MKLKTDPKTCELEKPATTEAITIEHDGPIADFSTFVSADGGLTVFHGDSGVGKSKTLEAISRLLGGKQSIERSDGAAQGRIKGLGVTLTLSKVCRTTGECVAHGLDGKFNLDDFIDPGLKDAEAADAKRTKALLGIRGIGADADRFRDLDGAPDTLAAILKTESVANATDLVDQARLVKAQLETKARQHEDAAATFDGAASACERVAGAVDLDGETDREKLQSEWEAAFANQNVLSERRNAADDGRKAVVTAEGAIAEAKADYTGPIREEAHQRELAYGVARDKADDLVAQLREQLDAAVVDADKTEATWDAANKANDAAIQHENLIAGWQATIDADRPKPVTDDDMNTAIQAVATAREAIDQGTRIRDARKKADEAQQHGKEATEARREAKRLRKAAHATDSVLSKAVASETIRVENGRLIVPHKRRGQCLVHELSGGERARLGVLEATAAIRSIHAEGLAVVVISQRIWGELSTAARKLVRKTAKHERVNIFTAIADHGELRAETADE